MTKPSDLELKYRRIAKSLRGKPSFDLLPLGSMTCLICKGPPSMSWWPGGKFWTIACPLCDNAGGGGFANHADAIAVWNRKNARAT